MRCRACDQLLSDFEATRKYASNNDYLDLCGNCFSYIISDLDTNERFDLFDPDKDTLSWDSVEIIYSGSTTDINESDDND